LQTLPDEVAALEHLVAELHALIEQRNAVARNAGDASRLSTLIEQKGRQVEELASELATAVVAAADQVAARHSAEFEKVAIVALRERRILSELARLRDHLGKTLGASCVRRGGHERQCADESVERRRARGGEDAGARCLAGASSHREPHHRGRAAGRGRLGRTASSSRSPAGYRVHRFVEDKRSMPITRTVVDREVSLVTVPVQESGTGFRTDDDARDYTVRENRLRRVARREDAHCVTTTKKRKPATLLC